MATKNILRDIINDNDCVDTILQMKYGMEHKEKMRDTFKRIRFLGKWTNMNIINPEININPIIMKYANQMGDDFRDWTRFYLEDLLPYYIRINTKIKVNNNRNLVRAIF